MIITIDGPAKSGKSRAAELLAAKLGFAYLNTGAMYRAAGLALRQTGWFQDLGDNRYVTGIQAFIDSFRFDMSDGVNLNGIDYTKLVSSPDAGSLASKIGMFPFVRLKLKAEQRRIARGKDMICEGRDQGTSVFPRAAVKFFITASPHVRAQRMAKTMTGKQDLEKLTREIAERDKRDSEREFDPLKPAKSAIIIDTSKLSAEKVVKQMLEAVKKWRSKA
jgi:cytidylate kinase